MSPGKKSVYSFRKFLFRSRRLHPSMLLPEHETLKQLCFFLELIRKLAHVIIQKVDLFIPLLSGL
jgi:hypothetical protein